MRAFLFWLGMFLLGLILETVVLPGFFGAYVPTLSLGVLVMGVSTQPFLAGFWFAGLSGLLRDSLAPPGDATHTIFFFLIFLLVHGFRIIAQWDEPSLRIGGALFALISIPVTWVLASRIGEAVLRLSPHGFSWRDAASATAVREVLFSMLWFSAFFWLTMRWFRRIRHQELNRIR